MTRIGRNALLLHEQVAEHPRFIGWQCLTCFDIVEAQARVLLIERGQRQLEFLRGAEQAIPWF
jgi:hypothetical protein